MRGGQKASTDFPQQADDRLPTLRGKGKTLFCAVFSLQILMDQRRVLYENQFQEAALAGVLCAVAVVGSMLQFPVFGSQCAPVQHMVNVICAVFLGPGYGVAVAFLASLLRNIFGLGSLLAFPGSMCGALLCGLVYWKTKNLPATLVGEVFGTGIIGGLLSYPVAVAFMGVVAGSIAFYAYVVPFLVSTVGGSILAGILVFTLQRSGALKSMQAALEH